MSLKTEILSFQTDFDEKGPAKKRTIWLEVKPDMTIAFNVFGEKDEWSYRATLSTPSASIAQSGWAKGTVVNGHAVCFLPAEEIEKVNVGNEAMVGGQPMTVSKLSALPLSPCSADGGWPCCLWRCFSSSGPALTQPFAWRSARFCS